MEIRKTKEHIRQRFGRLFVSIAFSYLLLILFIFGMGALSYAKAEEMMSRQIEQYNRQLLLQTQRAADETLSRVNQQISTLSMDTSVNRFAYTRWYLTTSRSILESLDVINRLNSARSVLRRPLISSYIITIPMLSSIPLPTIPRSATFPTSSTNLISPLRNGVRR